MIFSKKCEYAIRALTYLAQVDGVVGAREISLRQKAPYAFTAKVLRELRRKGFLKSYKGVEGGFTLAKRPYHIRLLDVFLAMDGDVLGRCLYGFSRCSDDAPCPLHCDWKLLRSEIQDYLSTQTVGHLSDHEASVKPVRRAR